MLAFLALGAARATTLDEAWAAAEQADLQVRLAEEEAIQAGVLRMRAWSALSPRVSAQAQYIVNNQEILLDFTENLPPEFVPLFGEAEPTVVQRKEFWQGGVTGSMRLFSGAALPGLKGAYAMTEAAREDVSAARDRSKASVAAAYYGALTAEQGVAVARRGLEVAKAQQSLAETQRAAGVGDERVVLQARLAVSSAERDVRSAEEGLVQARSGFELLTGLPADQLQLPAEFPVPEDPQGAVAEALVNRPDLRAMDLRLRAARMARIGHDLTWLPVVDAIGTYNYTENTGLATPLPWTWRVVLQASWDLWDGGARVANEKEAASRVRAAELGRALAADNAEREVLLAYEAHDRARTALAAVEADRAVAAESLRLAELGFAAGKVTWLEVEAARLQLQATELAILRERSTRDLAAIDLLQRTGKL